MRSVRGLEHIDISVSDEKILELAQHDGIGNTDTIFLPVEYLDMLIEAIRAEIAQGDVNVGVAE
jgi:hypothetical protein